MADKKPVVIGGLPHKAMLVAALGQTTPTPGDLSARQVIADMQSVADLRTIRHSYIGEKLKGWIAALSALPAVGGEVDKREIATFICDKLAGFRKVDAQLREDIAMAVLCMRPLNTTPQPSAAEWAERASPHGPWIHGHRTRDDFPPPDAAVGAQGDGMLPDALVPHATEWYRLCERRFYAERITISGELAEAIVEAIAAPATPAAGKGVDDAMVERALEAIWRPPFSQETKQLMRASLEAALTRQPVAGDGK